MQGKGKEEREEKRKERRKALSYPIYKIVPYQQVTLGNRNLKKKTKQLSMESQRVGHELAIEQ